MFEELLARGWQNFLARTTGPLHLRFFFQPLVATILAIRAGLRDASLGKPAFLWGVVTRADLRRSLMVEAVRDVGKVFMIATCLDFLYQVLVQRGVFLLELLFTALTLAFVPYVLIRGPVKRLATWLYYSSSRRKEGLPHGKRSA